MLSYLQLTILGTECIETKRRKSLTLEYFQKQI